jgi:hypothetical protein
MFVPSIKRDRFGRCGAEKIGDAGAHHRIVQQYSAPLPDRFKLMADEAREYSARNAPDRRIHDEEIKLLPSTFHTDPMGFVNIAGTAA